MSGQLIATWMQSEGSANSEFRARDETVPGFRCGGLSNIQSGQMDPDPGALNVLMYWFSLVYD
eukprot:11284452-Heterocapsa_arctica.AAC.1